MWGCDAASARPVASHEGCAGGFGPAHGGWASDDVAPCGGANHSAARGTAVGAVRRRGRQHSDASVARDATTISRARPLASWTSDGVSSRHRMEHGDGSRVSGTVPVVRAMNNNRVCSIVPAVRAMNSNTTINPSLAINQFNWVRTN